MKIIVGLGNPGPKYETTRHNLGFLALDHLIERWKATGPIVKHQAEIYSAKFKNMNLFCLKSLTFMNLSGRSIAPLFHFYRCSPNDLIVIHDDLDLQSMTLRLKTGGGTGGHNGLRSIDENLGKDMNQYHRVRIGIGRPTASESSQAVSAADYVLERLNTEELKAFEALLDPIAGAIEEILQGRVQNAMNQYHRSK